VKATQSEESLPGLRIGEVVLRTGRYEKMKQWYCQVLGMGPYLEHLPVEMPEPHTNVATQLWATQLRLCFFRLALDHPYQQVVAIFDVPGTQPLASSGPGLHHIQLRDQSPRIMARRHVKLRSLGIVPFKAMDHGPTTSFYYRDPDQNVVEIAAPNHAGVADFLLASQTPQYMSNPSGQSISPDTLAGSLDGP